jgi:hypothetical protein
MPQFDEEIRKVESMKNGPEYVCFPLCIGLSHWFLKPINVILSPVKSPHLKSSNQDHFTRDAKSRQTIGNVRCSPVFSCFDDIPISQNVKDEALIKDKEYNQFDCQKLCERSSALEILLDESVEDNESVEGDTRRNKIERQDDQKENGIEDSWGHSRNADKVDSKKIDVGILVAKI